MFRINLSLDFVPTSSDIGLLQREFSETRWMQQADSADVWAEDDDKLILIPTYQTNPPPNQTGLEGDTECIIGSMRTQCTSSPQGWELLHSYLAAIDDVDALRQGAQVEVATDQLAIESIDIATEILSIGLDTIDTSSNRIEQDDVGSLGVVGIHRDILAVGIEALHRHKDTIETVTGRDIYGVATIGIGFEEI